VTSAASPAIHSVRRDGVTDIGTLRR
jgi:hypothetical protein